MKALSLFQAVQYDKDNGYTTWLDIFQKKAISVSQEIDSLFNNTISKLNSDSFHALFEGDAMEKFITEQKVVDKNFKEWIKTVEESEFTLDNYKQYLQNTTEQTSIFTNFTTKAKNALKSLGATAASMLINAAISFAVSAIYELSKVSDNVAEKANELNDAYEKNVSTINDYNEQVSDLYKTINDSNSSVEEVTEARKTLMTIQDELIDKYGDEKTTIKMVTSAINGQADAWDRLADAQWEATKKEFNDGNVWNSISNWFSGYTDNIDRMADEMEKAYVDFSDISWFDEDNVELFEALKDAGYIQNQHDTLTLQGNLEAIYDDILNIQDIAQKYNAPASFLKELTKEANKAKETIDDYEGMWDNYILNDRIFADESLASNWKAITDAYSDYQDAMISGSETGIEKSIEGFASSLYTALNNSNADESVIEYFKDMYPTLVEEVEKWQFKKLIIPTFDTTNIYGLSKEQILSEIQTDGLQAAEETFNSILESASEYGIVTGTNTEKIQQLLNYLVEWGILQDDVVESAKTYSYSVFDQEAFNTDIKAYEDGYSKLIAAQEEWNESKAISASTFVDLQESGLLEYLEFTSEGLIVNKEKLLENAQACKEKAVADLHAAMTSDLLAIAVNDTSNISEAAQTVIAQLGNNAEIAGNQALGSVESWATLGETISTVLASVGVEGVSDSQKEQMSAVYDYYKNMAVDISNIDITIDSSNSVKKAAEETAKAAKESLEATLTVYKAELDSGIIDYKTYLKKCNDLLEDARDKAIITAQEYWDYQKEVLENQQDIYKKVINAAIRVYDKKIDSIQTVIDALKKENDALEKQLDKYDSVISAVSKYIDTQKDLIQNNIDGVEAENDVIQDEIDGYDQLLKAVTLVIDAKREAVEADQQAIQDRIDALQEENDEAKKAYELEQAKYELERLRNSRTKKIYVEGQGYIYDVDHSAIRDQEENVADLELDATIDALEKEKELLNNVLEQLDKTEEKWQAIADALDNAKALEKAKELLGDDFENIIIEGDDQSINAILNAYVDAQNKLEENNLLIEDYEKRIEQLEAIAEKWENTADIKEDTENEINAAEILGKEWSEDILADRAETYEEFCEKYLEIQSKITDNTSQIESLEEQIEIYEAYKQQWEDITDAYSNAQEDMYLTQVLGADAEADLLAGRIDTLENFKKEYLAIEQAIVDAAWNSANEQNKALASVGTGSTNGGGNITGGNGDEEEPVVETKYIYEVIDNSGESFGSFETRAKANSEKKRLGDSGEAEKPIHINTIEVPVKKYHKGLEEGYVGEDSSIYTKEERLKLLKGAAAAGLPPIDADEYFSVLQRGELVITEGQQIGLTKALLANRAYNVDSLYKNTLQPNWAAFKNNNTPATTVTIGDIHLHEVQNVPDFAAELNKYLPNISVQYNGRH